MIASERGSIRRGFNAVLPMLLLALSVAIPLIERADTFHEERWESGHDAEACPRGHDHTICTQTSANLWIRSIQIVGTLTVPRAVWSSTVSDPGHEVGASLPESNPTRAPPKV